MKLYSIEWHQNNLKDLKISFEMACGDVESALAERARLRDDIELLELQIAMAIKNKETLDREKYILKKK